MSGVSFGLTTAFKGLRALAEDNPPILFLYQEDGMIGYIGGGTPRGLNFSQVKRLAEIINEAAAAAAPERLCSCEIDQCLVEGGLDGVVCRELLDRSPQ